MGKVVAPNTIDAWEECEGNNWITFEKVFNLIVDGSGEIDGKGSAWWRKQSANQDDFIIIVIFPTYSYSYKISFSRLIIFWIFKFMLIKLIR